MLGREIMGERRNRICKPLSFLLAITSVAALGINYEMAEECVGGGIIYEILVSLHGWGLGQFLFVICLTGIYGYVRTHFLFRRDVASFSLFLSSLVVMGLCYRNATGIILAVAGPAQIAKTGIVLLGYGALIYCAILFLQKQLQELEEAREMQEEETEIVYHGMKVGGFLFLCWLPYLVVLYPGTALYDAGTMLEQYYGYAPMTNHHPFFQIMLLGFFVQAGEFLGSAAFGMFLYVLVQETAFITVLVYLIKLLKRKGIGPNIRKKLVFLYAFLPVFPIYALSVGKNINFSIVVLMLTVFLLEAIDSPDEFACCIGKMLLLPALLVLLCLFRNEGLAIALGFCPCFILAAKRYWKRFACIFTGVVGFMLLWLKVILPLLGVAGGSIAESLSIPFLQTARCVAYYGEEMTEEEKAAIDAVLEFDTLSERYLPEFSDRVKERYNNDATDEEINAYLQVYFRQMAEHPVTYIDAFLNKCYGYFYPDDKGRTKEWFVVGADIWTLNEDGFDLKSKFPEAVRALRLLLESFREVPLLGYTTSIGFYTWCAFLAAFLIAEKKRWKLLLLFVPSLVVLLVCAASPVNAYFRYGLPIVFSVPFFAAVVVYVGRGFSVEESSLDGKEEAGPEVRR